MDKSVYNMKAEKIQKQVKQGDYETAVKICDTIDWTQVRSVRMLSLVSSVYEHVGRYDTAIDILLMAHEEAPVGRRLLYKLTELAIASKDIKGAEGFYKDYIREADDDNARYVLRYKIAEAKNESIEKRISILEAYKRQEFDEQWAYRLAELYGEVGDEERCTKLCDEIILWFGVGTYVDKAMELKEQFAPLTADQMDHRTNRAAYEEHLREVQRDLAKSPEVSSDIASSLASGVMEEIEKGDDMPQVAISDAIAMTNAVESGQQVSVDPSAFLPDEEVADEDEEDNMFARTRRVAEKSDFSRTRIFKKLPDTSVMSSVDYGTDVPAEEVATGNTLKVEVPVVTGDTLKTEMLTANEEPTEDDDIQVKAEEPLNAVQMEFNWADIAPATPAEKLIFLPTNSPIEAEEMAVDAIKASHESERTSLKGITKISGNKLNAKGVINSLEALKDKDLIILGASAMDDEILEELMLVKEKFDTKKFFVLADSEAGIENVKARIANLGEKGEEEDTETEATADADEVDIAEVSAVEPKAAAETEAPAVEPETPANVVEEIAAENEFAFDDSIREEFDDGLPEIKLNEYFDDLEEASETAEPAAEEAEAEVVESVAEETAEAETEVVEPVAEEIAEAQEESADMAAEETVVETETIEPAAEEIFGNKTVEPADDEDDFIPEIKLTPDEELIGSESKPASIETEFQVKDDVIVGVAPESQDEANAQTTAETEFQIKEDVIVGDISELQAETSSPTVAEPEFQVKTDVIVGATPELQTSEQERAEEPIQIGDADKKSEQEKELQFESKSSRTMSPEDFMRYVKKYMKKIDCVFDEGAEEEVQAYIEKLFGEGEQLDTILAEDMVEDAADAAESHNFGNLFKSRYNSDGYLLLRAKHFV